MPQFKYRLSLYLTLALTIMLSVLTVLALHTRNNHIELKNSAIKDMKANSTKTIELLRKNIAGDIEAYTVNEYDRLVYNEMKSSHHLAIIIEDYNMGQVLGQKAYISGKIKIKQNIISDYDQNNVKHNKIIKEAFFSQTKDILSSKGKVIGKISVYISDTQLNKKLDKLIQDLIFDFVTLTLTLTIILFSTIYYFIMKPISTMSKVLSKQDEYGIPVETLHQDGPREVSSLAKTINFMLDSIKKSRLKIQEQNKEIKNERDRFELAVDGTQDGLWDWDAQSDTYSYSDRFYEMLGYDKKDLLHTQAGWTDYLIHPKDVKKALEVWNSYVQNTGKKNTRTVFVCVKKITAIYGSQAGVRLCLTKMELRFAL